MSTQPITRNLGGDRLGSGAKNNITLHNYNRSTHDLSYAWRSSMTVGTLVPFMKELSLNGDTFSIDLQSVVRTLPATGPMFGSYKLQLDIFECPIRLYNGLLHNNMTKVGMEMSRVILPKIEITSNILNPCRYTEINRKLSQVASNALLRYCGIKGFADLDWKNTNGEVDDYKITRKFNAVPILAYYDIYKNYYANKQEEKGVVITAGTEEQETTATKANVRPWGNDGVLHSEFYFGNKTTAPVTVARNTFQYCVPYHVTPADGGMVPIENLKSIEFDGIQLVRNMQVVLYNESQGSYLTAAIDVVSIWPHWEVKNNIFICNDIVPQYAGYRFAGLAYDAYVDEKFVKTELQQFDLNEIDNARVAILRDTGLDNEFQINTLSEPYSTLFGVNKNDECLSKYPQQGLCIKTYQSDLLNNWLQTEWIDGANGINAITAIDVSSGTFTIDALNLANKVYNMLNRIAVSGGSYEDWQEAVYTVKANKRAETPVYRGGMSAEIMFDEVISTMKSEDDPLGTLAGRGFTPKESYRGGNIEISSDEPCYIMGIVSITPRIDYSDGNDWDMTELNTMDDLHKPQLDGIGFEDLLQERAAWWGTYFDRTNGKYVKLAAGKVPAWINYMTQLNKTFGDFADETKAMFMTLNRRYEMPKLGQGVPYVNGIADMTTYIDPTKYNYMFADSTLESQNFWVQIGVKNITRRVMSGKIIPNL